ncbi:MAG: hypothetical protein LBQ79_12190 [Deltaproteobacteria bacterium]|jgi:hypothetical protein|nr:hypothetical protein [Deltaproteobacteria bacterium]
MRSIRVIMAALAAAIFLASVQPDASAESPITFSGYLRLRTLALGGFFASDEHLDKVSDRYAISRLRVNVEFKPNDKVSVRWRFHGPHGARFGSTNTGPAGDFSLFSQYFYGVAKTDWGTFSAGRISYDVDSAGLRTLGYAPLWGFGTSGNIFDRDSENDGIMYFNEWDNGFGVKAFYIKRAHGLPRYADSLGVTHQYYKDVDYDRYSIEPFYRWETGGASLALQYDRNNYNYTYGTNLQGYTANNNPAGYIENVDKNYVVTINPAFYQSWAVGGDKTFTVHAEAKYAFGKRRRGKINGVTQREIKQDGFGAYVDFTLAYPQGDSALAGWYFRGNDAGDGYDPPDDWKDHSLVNPGEGFYPFILFYYGNLFLGAGGARDLEGNQAPGHWALALLGNHSFNEYITLNYAIGSFRKTNDWYRLNGEKASRSLGTEVDLGLTIKILDNLQWQTKFAVFDAGRYYSDRWERPEFHRTVWGWGNEFLFTF